MLSFTPATHIAAFISWARARGGAETAALFLFLFAGFLAGGAATARGQSALDGFDPNANGTVEVVVLQPNGKILIGGTFTALSPNGGAEVTRNHIARLNPDGTLDTTFDPNANSNVSSIAVQADGKILVGGNFTTIGGQTRNYIARLDGATGLADSFDPQANDLIAEIAVQAGGEILVGGNFTTIGGQTRNYIARLDSTTGLADSFNPQADNIISEIVVQADGKILVGGGFTTIGGEVRNGIARLDVTTGLADSFNPNPRRNIPFTSSIYAIAVQADGKILAGGIFDVIGGEARRNIARLDPTTGFADSFDPNAGGAVQSIAIQPDGKILVGGGFGNIGGQTRGQVARLNPGSGLADSFHPNIQPSVTGIPSIVVQADGKILVGGNFSTVAPNGGPAVTRNHIARLEREGTLDQTLDLGIMSTVFPSVDAIAVKPDGKILIGGKFTSVLGVERHYMAQLNPDGTLDTVFNPAANDGVSSIAVQADGKILVGGLFTSIGGQTRNCIARLDATTGLADSFDPNASNNPNASVYVKSIVVQPDGQILAGGFFTNIGGQERNNIARLDATTGLADSFNPDSNANSSVFAIALQADGKILAGGDFNRIGGQTRNNIARLDPTTGLADSFDPNANILVQSIVVQPDGKILAGGYFNTIGGQTRNHIARLDPVTGLADLFNPNATNVVVSIAVQADGKILVGGAFTFIGGRSRDHIARLDSTTGLVDSFEPNLNSYAGCIALQADGKILVSGGFTRVDEQERYLFARLTNDLAALQNLAVTQTNITWTRDGSSPHLARVTFEYSSDNVNYSSLGHGTMAGSDWSLTGLDLPTGQNFYIRARGHYRSGDTSSESITESVRNAFIKILPTQAINLSTRMRVQTGDNVGIGGFIITGTAPKYVLLRGIGPSLTQFGVPNALADPVLELYRGSSVVAYNNNWKDTDQSEIEATGIPPTNDFEAAIAAMLSPGAYTAILRGNDGGTGIALVEAYDLGQAVPAKLGNISTRALVGTGDDIVIAGFTLGNHSGNSEIVVRGLGPSLLSVPNALANPKLELRNSNGTLLVFNNDWQDDPDQAAELTDAGLAPTNQLESGLVVTLPPGPYTALLFGENNGTGVGLVEVYDRGAP